MPGIHTVESLSRRATELIQHLEARDMDGAEAEADALLEDLQSLVTPIYDRSKQGQSAPVHAAEQTGLNLSKTRALKATIQRALSAIEAGDHGQALRLCHQALTEWAA